MLLSFIMRYIFYGLVFKFATPFFLSTMGCAFTKPKTRLPDNKKDSNIVVGEVVEKTPVVQGKSNVYDKTNMTRFRNVDSFSFSAWKNYQTNRMTRHTPEIRHCIHTICIRANQAKTGTDITTTVDFNFPQPFLDSMPLDLKSMSDVFTNTLIVQEYKDCVDILDYASQCYPEMQTIKSKILSIAFADN